METFKKSENESHEVMNEHEQWALNHDAVKSFSSTSSYKASILFVCFFVFYFSSWPMGGESNRGRGQKEEGERKCT